MTELKLSKLPDRTPIKLTIQILPDLHQRLVDYAQLYASVYGTEEPVVELVPAMLVGFLESDRAFSRTRSIGKQKT